MATTRLIAMHQNKGKTIADCLGDRTDYAKNPDKTKEGELVSAYGCDPKTVQGEFMLSKRVYEDITGRTQKNNVIAYQIRQSFKPGEVTAEIANKIGYELGMKFTKSKHAFIVATHVDKAHIHNHIIFNSTSLDGTRKFRDFLGSGRAVAKISDGICLVHGLSIIENPKKSRGHYGTWLGDKKVLSHSQILKNVVDDILHQKPESFELFLQRLQEEGYEVKQGKYIAVKGGQQKRFIRLHTLGKTYSEEEIRRIIDGEVPEKSMEPRWKNHNLLLAIQEKLEEVRRRCRYGIFAKKDASRAKVHLRKENPYAGKRFTSNRRKVLQLKKIASAINFIRENNLTDYNDLERETAEITKQFHELNAKIKATEKEMAEVQNLKTHIINYMKTKEVYGAYRKSGYSKKYLAEHEGELLLHKAAKNTFNELGVEKLPTIKSLQNKYFELRAMKKETYNDYQKIKSDMQELLQTKATIDGLFEIEEKKKRRGKSRGIHL